MLRIRLAHCKLESSDDFDVSASIITITITIVIFIVNIIISTISVLLLS